jgi:hypothetical protein
LTYCRLKVDVLTATKPKRLTYRWHKVDLKLTDMADV